MPGTYLALVVLAFFFFFFARVADVFFAGFLAAFFLAAFFVDKGHAAFTAKWGISKHYVEIFAWMATQAILYQHRLFALFIAADTMQKKVHHTEASGIIDDFPAAQGIILEKAAFIAI